MCDDELLIGWMDWEGEGRLHTEQRKSLASIQVTVQHGVQVEHPMPWTGNKCMYLAFIRT